MLNDRAVFLITIRYGHGGKQRCFRIRSDADWWAFRLKACKRLGANPATARLAYRQLRDVLYGSLCRLRGAGDWKGAMLKMKEADEENAATQLEVVNVAGTTSVGAREPHAYLD